RMREQVDQYKMILHDIRRASGRLESEPPRFTPHPSFTDSPPPEIYSPSSEEKSPKEVMFAASTPTSKLRGDAPEFVPGKPYEAWEFLLVGMLQDFDDVANARAVPLKVLNQFG
ncbi:hypothetical protein KXX27_007361, partial [Aspergillus fumigatus]